LAEDLAEANVHVILESVPQPRGHSEPTLISPGVNVRVATVCQRYAGLPHEVAVIHGSFPFWADYAPPSRRCPQRGVGPLPEVHTGRDAALVPAKKRLVLSPHHFSTVDTVDTSVTSYSVSHRVPSDIMQSPTSFTIPT
jgi:hypothetical protein